jgi:septin family protein
MSKMITRLVTELVAEDMLVIKKMKKADIIALAESLLKENMLELSDDTIVDIYEEKFNTHLVRI